MPIYGRQRGQPFTLSLPLVAAGSDDWKTTPTIAAGDIKISKDGGAFANVGTLPAETPASGGIVEIALTAVEMNADRIVVKCHDVAGAEWKDTGEVIYTERRLTRPNAGGFRS